MGFVSGFCPDGMKHWSELIGHAALRPTGLDSPRHVSRQDVILSEEVRIMPSPQIHSSSGHAPTDLHARSLHLAAEAYLAHMHPRAPLRLERVRLRDNGGVEYRSEPDGAALRLNRALAEEVVLVALAAEQAAHLSTTSPFPAQRDARHLLATALNDPDELATLDAYLDVLRGRTRARLRRAWTEVEVLAAGLREHGELDASQVAHRVACAQGIRSSLLN